MNNTISEAIREKYGNGVSVTGRSHVYGGDINESSLLTLSNGEKMFVKQNRGMKTDFFEAEAQGLRSIASTGAVKAARPVAVGIDEGRPYLLLEYISSGQKTSSFWEDFGRKLAGMHRAGTSSFTEGGLFGYISDNYIGSTRQINTVHSSWIDFYRTRRLEPQFKMAWRYFDKAVQDMTGRLLDGLDRWLIEPDHPSLLHGDLWGGNFMVSEDGEPVLIDPAVYVGHAEADIAMTELFGGFAPAFYDSYRAENPFADGYGDRRDLYNLYHLLNHLNLFGRSYLGGVVRIISHYAG